MRVFFSTLVVTLGLMLFSSNATATSVTTCTENALGDQTCTTVTTTTTTTPGTTTGNVLTNSTFGTGTDPNETTTTNGWSTSDGHSHTHGMFGQNMGNPQSGQDITGGVYAFEGDPSHSVYQDTDLVGDGHLTKSQVNEGFTSTQSADVWFWNSLKNTLTIKQTITDSNGNVTTQTRVIVDHEPSRSMNGGSWSNETNVYTHSSNTANDITIRAEMYNDTDGTTYDGYHRGPDIDNFELSITTNGSTSSSSTSSTVVTLCADRTPPTCTTAGDDVADAIEEIEDAVTGDDGQSIDQSIETIVETEVIDVDPVIEEEIYVVQTVIEVEDDFGSVEELTIQEFVQESFIAIIEEEGLQEEFQDALSDEGITEQEFFEEIANEMENEFAESGVENITATNTDPLPVIEEAPVEEVPVEEAPVEETVVETNTVEEEASVETNTVEETETESVNNNEESVETESEPAPTESENTTSETETTENEANTSSETSETSNEEATTETETEESSSQSEETTNESEAEQEESSSNEEESVEESNEETSSEERDDGDTGSDRDSVDSEVGEITKKVERIIKKLEGKLKTINQKLKVVSLVTQKAMIEDQPDLSEYTQTKFYDTRKMQDNPDWYAEDTILDAYGRSIYQDKTLIAYQINDPVFQHTESINRVNETISRLEAELEVLRNENAR